MNLDINQQEPGGDMNVDKRRVVLRMVRSLGVRC